MAVCGLRVSGPRATPAALGGASAGGKTRGGLAGQPACLFRMLIGMTIPLTGTQYEIEAGDYRATVTELGAGLRELEHAGTPARDHLRRRPAAAARRGRAAVPVAEPRRRGSLLLRRHAVPAGPVRACPRQRDPRPDPLGPVDQDRARPQRGDAEQHPARVAGIPVRRPGRRDLPGRRGIRPARHRHRHQQGQPAGPLGLRPAPVPDRRVADRRRLRADAARSTTGCRSTSG